MDSKVRARLARTAIILFWHAVDAPLRYVLFWIGFIVIGITIVFLSLGPIFTTATGKAVIENSTFMYVLSMSITGIAALRVALRSRPYRYDPPYLKREIINKRTTVIPLSILGIAGIFYIVPTFDASDTLTLPCVSLICVAGFLCAMFEAIILGKVVLALGDANKNLVNDAATNSTGKNAHVTKPQGDGPTRWGSWLILIIGVITSFLLTILCLRLSLLDEADLLARTNPVIASMGVWGFFLSSIIFIWGIVELHFARSYLFKPRMEQPPGGSKERSAMGVVVMCDVLPFVALTMALSYYVIYNNRLPPLIIF